MPQRVRFTAAAILTVLLLVAAMFVSSAVAQGPAKPAPPAATSSTTPSKPKPPPVKPTARPAAKPTDKAEEITWDDLLPPGEEARIEELYEAYFRDMEDTLRRNQSQLTAPTRMGKPPMDLGAIAEGSGLDFMPQIGTFNTVADLNNRKIRIPAYIVPLDFSAKGSYKEFLLAPYFGACIHSPPPPPNQMIYVKANPPAKITDIWGAVWAEGILTTTRHKNDVGSAAYTLTLTKIVPYQ